MPKKQPTAAKRARAASRASGAKYTAALARALSDEERMVADCLRALAAQGGRLAVRNAEPDPEVVAARFPAAEEGRAPQWQRWASVQAGTDGYVLRESQLTDEQAAGYAAFRGAPARAERRAPPAPRAAAARGPGTPFRPGCDSRHCRRLGAALGPVPPSWGQ
ncbi:hypothetical protein ACFCXK_09130 [Streptomyces sp. NPDC056269]|uniref:hypothetical protein n=1 Tax=Streptomyces sp. NPDC056269 TaxID=3345768 RepID=UPI0035D6C04C